MKSIIQKDTQCIVCGNYQAEDHHIFFGSAKRKLSEEYGLKVWLCSSHHRGTYGVHGKKGHVLDMKLKQLGQEAFEYHYPDLDFLKIFGRSYVD